MAEKKTVTEVTEEVKAPKQDWVEIILPMPTNPEEPDQEFFSVNGKNYIIKCGIPVKVPLSVKEVLDHKYEMIKVQRKYVAETYRESK